LINIHLKRELRLLRVRNRVAPDRLMIMTRYALTSDPGVSVEIVSAALACCTMEVQAAIHSGELIEVSQVDTGPTVIVIAGTVTDALAPSVVDLIRSYPGTKVMSFGACATSGGPYWDSPPVSKGIDQFVEVASYVAGCPPRPEAFVLAIEELAWNRVD
jgi:NADH-quinone oxidoreductase subunit B